MKPNTRPPTRDRAHSAISTWPRGNAAKARYDPGMKQAISAVLAAKPSPHVETIGRDATVLDAVDRMNDKRIGSLLVMNGDQPVGIFTERDVLVRVVAGRRDPAMTTVGEVMSVELVTVTPATPVDEVMGIMTETRCRHLPVMEGARVLGLASIGDVTRHVVRLQNIEIADLRQYIMSG